MTGSSIGVAKYLKGHSDLGDTPRMVELIGDSNSLTVKQVMNSQVLFSVPWGNFRDASAGVEYKEGLAMAGAVIMSSLPVLNLFNSSSSFHDGVWLNFWDEEIDRGQTLFFATNSERSARKIANQLYQFRDNYQRNARRASGPERRVPPGQESE